MLPNQTILLIPKEILLLQNIVHPNGNHSQMYLLPPNFNTNISSIEHDHRYIDHHISSIEIQQSMVSFKTNRDMNHKIMALAYSLQPNLSQDYYNGNMHQNNLLLSPMNSSVCTRICDPILITKESRKIQLPEFYYSIEP
ncbi:unnamed protein product [Rotaria magnacalcarata]|uniref:Uncharacterized protein n=1 Tax=Rotaria magnacalcarata TaxID=392030 RepID=A0A816TWB5_9BILA|nr:unnamed protein product [Rotaria magnacalcarata]